MYYYIIEPSKGKFTSRNTEKIKDVLGDLGIAGETVMASSARTVEELTHLGVVKGYSTIVAVGSEMLVNKVLTILATDQMAKETVLGVIPDDYNSPLAQKLGINDLMSACNALKYRRLRTMNLCLIEPNKFLLTEAVIESNKNMEIFFSMANVKGKSLARKVIIRPGLEISIYDQSFEGGISKKILRWLFGKKEKDIFSSFFITKRIRFEAEKDNLPIKVSGEIIAKTPATFSNRNKQLKIITARDRIVNEKEKNPPREKTGGRQSKK